MQTKKVSIRLSLSLLSVAILVPLVSRVNHFARISKEQINPRSLQADGAPLPPPPRTVFASGALVADGAPLPPPPHPDSTLSLNGFNGLMVDGAPLPPPPPWVA